MDVIFYISAIIAVFATVMVITRLNAVHALLYLIVSLLAVAVIFCTLGAPFVAALEVIVYAGAIMVLFVFVIMMFNLGPQAAAQERQWFSPKMVIGPAVLGLILLVEFCYAFSLPVSLAITGEPISPQQVGIALFSRYLLGVELSSILLLAALVGAYHLGRRQPFTPEARTAGMAGITECSLD